MVGTAQALPTLPFTHATLAPLRDAGNWCILTSSLHAQDSTANAQTFSRVLRTPCHPIINIVHMTATRNPGPLAGVNFVVLVVFAVFLSFHCISLKILVIHHK